MHGMEDHQRPFVWEDSGVTYSSDCLAFEKNMWIISDAVDKWNEAVPSYDMIDGKAFIRDYAKPAVAGLNHLIDGGGIGDFQTAPTDPRLMPRTHDIAFLKSLRSAFKALAWNKAADAFQGKTPSTAARWKMEAVKAAVGAQPHLTKSWAQGRLIEAGDLAGAGCKASTEDNPDVDVCKKAIQIYDATLAAIGWGVGCLANVDKAQLLRNKNILINDMKAVYEQQRFDPKKLPKKTTAASSLRHRRRARNGMDDKPAMDS